MLHITHFKSFLMHSLQKKWQQLVYLVAFIGSFPLKLKKNYIYLKKNYIKTLKLNERISYFINYEDVLILILINK